MVVAFGHITCSNSKAKNDGYYENTMNMLGHFPTSIWKHE